MPLFDTLFKRKKREEKDKKPLPNLPKPKPQHEEPDRFKVPLPSLKKPEKAEAPKVPAARAQKPKSSAVPKAKKPTLKTPEGMKIIRDELIADVANLSERDSQLDMRRQDLILKIASAEEEFKKLRKKIVSDSIIDSAVAESLSSHEQERDKDSKGKGEHEAPNSAACQEAQLSPERS